MGLNPSNLPPEFTSKIVDTKARQPVKLPPSFGTVYENAKAKPTLEQEMNKTERRLYEHLQALGIYREVKPFAITLYLGHKCRYTADFVGLGATRPAFIECKGAHVYEDSLVKFKVAAAAFPDFDFYWAQWKNNEWKITRYGNRALPPESQYKIDPVAFPAASVDLEKL